MLVFSRNGSHYEILLTSTLSLIEPTIYCLRQTSFENIMEKGDIALEDNSFTICYINLKLYFQKTRLLFKVLFFSVDIFNFEESK